MTATKTLFFSVMIVNIISSPLTVQAQTQNITATAYVHFNEEAVMNGGSLVHEYLFIDGQRYGTIIFDTSDIVYGSDPIPGKNVFTKPYQVLLTMPSTTKEVCLGDNCLFVNEDTTEIHFIYPTGWTD